MAAPSLVNYFKHRFSLKAAIVTTIVIAVWAVFLWRVIVVLGPNSLHSNFDSDSAIPVLMANDQRPITIFDWYYYGQDRWGAWPLIAARIVHHATNFRWSDYRLHVLRAIWLFTGILALASLNSRAGPMVVVGCLIPICLNVIRLQLFDVGQVYSWQITALILAWFCGRRFLRNEFHGSWISLSNLEQVTRGLLLFLFSLLAIWSSPVSGPMLLFLVILEAWRAHLQDETTSKRRLIARCAYAAVPVAAAIVAEIVMRTQYHRHGLKHYGDDFRTSTAIDFGHLITNLRIQFIGLDYFTWWGFMVIPVFALFSAAATILYFRLKRRNDLWKIARQFFVHDTAILIVGTFGIAVINFLLMVMLTHVRLASYHTRFMTLTVVFGTISGVLTIYLVFDLALRETRIRSHVAPALAIAGFLFVALEFPPKIDSPKYKLRTEIASTLAQKTPGGILMGGYWETYVFTALQPPNTMTALPIEGRYVRMPWTPAALQNANQVVVEYRESKLTDADSLPQELQQYGTSLRLTDPKFYENGPYSFALYHKE